MIELLAPCGNEKSFFSAVDNGADAVYLGLESFSARGSAENFTKENLSYYISYAHAVGVKVYVALNTIIKDKELKDFFECLYYALSVGADAIILQDVFLGKKIKELYTDSHLHLSTQAGINEVFGAEYAVKNGFERVILSRETALPDIKRISEVIETEIFVQGALCASFSGHCLFSSFVGGNSGNRGYCKQPCRQKYSFSSGYDGGEYPISLSDLSLINNLKEIESAGVKSIKIEGRMRSPEYVAATVKAYRSAIDGKPFDISEMERTFNRGNYTKGYIFGQDKNLISDKVQSHIGKFVGNIVKISGDRLIVNSDKSFTEKDAFKILRNGIEVGNAVYASGKILFKGNAKVGDGVYITKDGALSKKLLSVPRKKKEITVNCKFVAGEKAELSYNDIKVYSELPLESAKTKAVDDEEILSNLRKTDLYPFEPKLGKVIFSNAFILKSELNKMRSSLYEKIFNQNEKQLKNAENIDDFKLFYNKRSFKNVYLGNKKTEIDSDDAFVYLPENYDELNEEKISKLRKTCLNLFLFVPAFLPFEDGQFLEKIIDKFDGVYADGISALGLAEKLGKKVIIGAGLNVFNSLDISVLQSKGYYDIVLSAEASEKQIEKFEDLVYSYTEGGIRLMDILFCPFGKKCSECRRGSIAEFKDDIGHKFYLFRYKLNGKCRFEIYNGSALKIPKRERNFINLLFGEDEIRLVTSGNYKREVK